MAANTPGQGRGIYAGEAAGNRLLTSATAAALTVLLVAVAITILEIGGLATEHMLIGLALVPPVVLKRSSTGSRFPPPTSRAPCAHSRLPGTSPGPGPVPGGRVRGPLVAGAVRGGVALAVSLLRAIYAGRP